MAEQLSTFKIQIDGEWTATEMSREIQAINHIHNMFFLASALYSASSVVPSGPLDFVPTSPKDRIVASLTSFGTRNWTDPFLTMFSFLGEDDPVHVERRNNTDLDLLVKELSDTQLSISQIRYGSPGFQDFFGIAKIVQEVLNFINGLIKIGMELRKEKLDLERQRQDIELQKQKTLKLKLDNLASFLKTLRDNGVGDREIETILQNINPYQMILVHFASENKITSAQSSARDEAA